MTGPLASEQPKKPGPKPKRLYARLASRPADSDSDFPGKPALRAFLGELDRAGRLVAAGETERPAGHLLLLRARDLPEASRVLRHDPWRVAAGPSYELRAWDPQQFGGGVNLEPAPARGSGRLTVLDHIAVFVRDQARALEWYQEVLGLRVRQSDPATGYVELSLGRGAAGLSLIEPRRGWGEPFYSETMARVGTATGIVFRTDSAAALQMRLEHSDSRVSAPPARQPWGGIALQFRDPDGNEFLAFEAERAGTPRLFRPEPQGRRTRRAVAREI